MTVIWIVTAVCAIMSIVLLCGKGGFLIAGYNTASAGNKAKYDEKKLSRVMGAGMSVITVMLMIMALMGENAPGFFIWIFLAVVFVDIVFMMILTNTRCKAADKGSKTVINTVLAEKEETSRKTTIILTVIFAAIFITVGTILMTGNINVTCADNQISIDPTYWKDDTIKYDDVKSVAYSEDNVAGRRNAGFGSFKLNLGRFEDKETYGMYTRYTYLACDACIVIETKENGIYVINAKNEEETRKLYEEISAAVK